MQISGGYGASGASQGNTNLIMEEMLMSIGQLATSSVSLSPVKPTWDHDLAGRLCLIIGRHSTSVW